MLGFIEFYRNIRYWKEWPSFLMKFLQIAEFPRTFVLKVHKLNLK